ncbi:hypothetical protein D018_1820B, partial [Vibrio parahaemolyticus VP2007-007]
CNVTVANQLKSSFGLNKSAASS